MDAIKKARKWAQRDPEFADYQVLIRLAKALESETDFNVMDLYTLNGKSFELAMKMLDQWRLDRYANGNTVPLGSSEHSAFLLS